MTSLERFVKRLVQVLEAKDPAGVHRPISVAELRTELMPYRTNRVPLGLTNNDDYELLVIRLVAEEGEYARTNPPGAAELARTEASHPNPNLDLIDDLADVTFQIGAAGLAKIGAVADLPEPPKPTPSQRLEFLDLSAPAPWRDEQAPEPGHASAHAEPGPEPMIAGPMEEPEPAPEPPPAPAPPPAPEPEFEALAETIDVGTEAAGPTVVPATAPAVATCRSCHSTLPDHRVVAFCPFCGTRQGPPVCGRCGTGVEPGWRHCVACGYLVPPGAFA